MSRALTLLRVDLDNPSHGATLLALLDHYAQDPMGGGKALDPVARARLLSGLRATPHYRGALAFCAGEAVGLINCFLGFSTFAAQPLLNIHDIVVSQGRRGEGIGQALLTWAEAIAREEGCCKLTLEVLSNNHVALQSYQRAGFAPYVLDPSAGQAQFLQRIL